MPRVQMTKEEIKEQANKEAATLQQMRYHEEKNPELEAWGLKVAKGFEGKDVSRHELQQLEGKIGLFHGYIEIALRYKLGYSIYEDQNILPVNHPGRTILTKRPVCPHCGVILPPEHNKQQDQ